MILAQANEIFKSVHTTKKRYIVMRGGAGSGKSADTAQQYILRLMGERGRNLLCVRKAETTNRDSTFAELQAAISRLNVESAWDSTTQPLAMQCQNGNRIIFRGVLNDREREKLKSITVPNGKITDVWLEEATELTQDDFEIIDDRLRGKLPHGLFYQIKMTFNPVSASHWIKKVFFDVEDENVFTHHSTYLDNRFIDEAYSIRMERRRLVDPEGYRIYGLGDWGESEGTILRNFEVKTCPVQSSFYDDTAIGQDFGFNHNNAILLLSQKDGNLYIRCEVVRSNMTTEDIISVCNGIVPKQVIMYCDSAEPDRIETWHRAGYRARAVEKEAGSVLSQIDWLKARKIYVDPSCVYTLKELQSWRWQKDNSTGEYLDAPVAVNDDAMAALRYGIEGWRKGNKFSW